jgi:hypothetical protein
MDALRSLSEEQLMEKIKKKKKKRKEDSPRSKKIKC